jgi:hypothetical protein
VTQRRDFGAAEGGSEVLDDFRRWAQQGASVSGSLSSLRTDEYLGWLPSLRGLRHPGMGPGLVRGWSADRRARLELLDAGAPGFDYLTAEELCELATLLPNLHSLYWAFSWRDPHGDGVEPLTHALGALPLSLRYLSVYVSDVGIDGGYTPGDICLHDWARPGLQKLFVLVEGYDDDFVAYDPSLGPQHFTDHVSGLMTAGHAVLIDLDRNILQQSVMHEVFLPGIPQEWTIDPRRRGR